MSTLLGKRKERTEDAIEQHGSTLFVSNLPYTATSTDLQTLFSDIAPVRSAFVVTESGTGVSKGMLRLHYDKISSEGLNLVGRNLRIQWADTQRKRRKNQKGSETNTSSAPHFPKAANDPLAIRTIVVSGIPSDIDSKVLWKKFRKYEGAEKVDWPVQSTGEADTAHVLFATPVNALDAVNKLHAHVFKGNLLSVGLKKRLDNLQKPSGQKEASAIPSRGARLIIRNIPFNTTDQDLRAVFLPYGPVHSINIPKEKKTDDDDTHTAKKVRTRGFAFVWMMSKKDAERAIEGCNGTVMRAGMAENMISDKQKRKKQRRVEKKMKEGMKKEKAEAEVEAEGDHDENEEDAEERTIAVDWALSKDKWEEEKAKIAVAEDEDVEMEDAASGSGSDSDSGSDSESDDEDDDGVGLHDGEGYESGSESSDSHDAGSDEDLEIPVKPQLPAPEAGTTLFVRNDELRTLYVLFLMPLNVAEIFLLLRFRAFGPLRYARITMDPETGRSRGTGFACFWNKDDADKAVEQSDLLRSETGLTEAPKQNPFKLPSILTPDPSSSLARSLVLQGRTLDVVRAVTRDQAGKLKEEGEKRREKADKRNMYLLREGVILPNTPAAESLSPADLERRTSSFSARKTLLKSNPLSLQRLLRRLSVHATKTFNSEVKNGKRAGLTPDELHVEPDPDAEQETTDKGKKKPFVRKTGVQQAKLVRQQERIDPVTGKGRSKGYGFVEMHTHADALRVLRWANNNPSVGELFEGWWKEELKDLLKAEKSKGTLIVEFSIENIQVVQRRKAHQDERKKSLISHVTRMGHRIRRNLKRSSRLSSKKSLRQRKRQKLPPSKVHEGDVKPKPGQSVGFLIGRKRKERKGGKKH
ncbi:hypothetical protein BT96DRAFT_953357 [Gymnopus androsaceus JB14]|uniref:RRM domain-containing protein n=1 Tax=Gymnopus androsaceus JB14 TaxID=1447944 RepID=A0A6A4IHT0_9AGAR|nr:hypothetical protein BT96DRAFT_953357 [Gymnopus androsaceus JB14]